MANFPALRERTGILRTVCLVMSLIALIFIIVALHIHGTDDFIGYEASFADAISITAYVWTTLWSFSALCVLVFHGPYHPAVDIALDFIGFGLAWGWAPVVIYWTAYINAPGDCQYSSNGPDFCTWAKALMALEILAGILAITYGAIHLFLMGTACKAVAGMRKTRRNKSVDSELQDGEHLTGTA